MPIFLAIWAVMVRNSQLLLREKHLVLQPVLVPLVVLTLTSLIMGGEKGDVFPTAFVNQDDSTEGAEFEAAIRGSRSNISPYFNLVEIDAEGAKAAVASGRLLLAIEVPEDFNQSGEVLARTFNVNTDATKNIKLRLEHAINRYLEEKDRLIVRPNLSLERPEDVWRSAYFGGSSVLLALLLGATLIAANLFAYEKENRTSKEVYLSPLPPVVLGLGIVPTVVIAAAVTSLPTLVTAMLLFKLDVALSRLALVYGAMVPVLLACAAAGIALGVLLVTYRALQPIIILALIATFFVGGGFVGVNMLPAGAQSFSKLWLLSRVFEWFNPVLHGFGELSVAQLAYIGIAGLVGILMLIPLYRFSTRRVLSGGQ